MQYLLTLRRRHAANPGEAVVFAFMLSEAELTVLQSLEIRVADSLAALKAHPSVAHSLYCLKNVNYVNILGGTRTSTSTNSVEAGGGAAAAGGGGSGDYSQ